MKPHNQPHPILKSVPYFSGLDQATLKAVARTAIRRTYQPNQVILTEGEPSRGFYVIESGWIKVTKFSFEGREQVLKTLGPGDSFNAISVFTEAPNQANVATLENVIAWFIPKNEMLRLLDENPALAQLIIQDLAGKVMHLVGLVEDLSLRTVESRLARLLLEHAENDILARRRWATQAEMANRIGTVPDVLNRTLRKLIDAGYIQVNRQEIRILDHKGLEKVASIQ